MNIAWTTFAAVASLLAEQPLPEAAEVKYSVALIAAIASIVVAIISAFFSTIGLVISRMNQRALQREQAQLTQSNQTQLESLKAQLTLKTQNELESAKAALTESTQSRLEGFKKQLEQRARVTGHVGDNRFKAAEVLMTGYKGVTVQIYAYQRVAEKNRDWAAVNRQHEITRLASLLTAADDKFATYSLYFDGRALKEIAIVYAELMDIICNDIENSKRLDKINLRTSVLFTLLREQLGIEPLSLDVDALLALGDKGEESSKKTA